MAARRNNRRAVVLTASFRRGSNSVAAAGILACELGLKNVLSVNFCKTPVKPCCACNTCENGGKCGIKDRADVIMEKVKGAAIVIVSSPIYFCGVPAPMKAFIDRNQVMWVKSKIQNPKPKINNKKGYIILTAGDAKKKHFTPAEMEIKSFFAVNNIKCAGIARLNGLDKAGSLTKRHIAAVKRLALK